MLKIPVPTVAYVSSLWCVPVVAASGVPVVAASGVCL